MRNDDNWIIVPTHLISKDLDKDGEFQTMTPEQEVALARLILHCFQRWNEH